MSARHDHMKKCTVCKRNNPGAKHVICKPCRRQRYDDRPATPPTAALEYYNRQVALERFEEQYAQGLRGECVMPIGKMRGTRLDAIRTEFLVMSLGSIRDPNRREHFPHLEDAMECVLRARSNVVAKHVYSPTEELQSRPDLALIVR